MPTAYKLPDLGENVEGGTVATVLVKEGDTVKEGDALIEIETDKAASEVPAEVAGKVVKILVSEGDEVSVGQGFVEIEADGEGTGDEETEEAPQAEARQNGSQGSDAAEEKGDAGGVVEVPLPSMGDDVDAGTVASILVSVGDAVKKGDPLIEVETDKAAAEVPSEYEGTITEILVKEGDEITVGDPVVRMETAEGGSADTDNSPTKEARPDRSEGKAKETSTNGASAPAAASTEKGGPIPASPSTRRLARELSVDIHAVQGTGPHGWIFPEDVRAHAEGGPAEAPRSAPAQGSAVAGKPLPDFTKFGEVRREAMSKIRQATAENMAHAWNTVPAVTQYDKADITDLEAFRKEYGPRVKEAGGKLTVTGILAKVLVGAMRRYPQFNASIDVDAKEIVFKNYFHIGIAVDTERGLLVPVLRDADRKGLTQISVELGEMAEKARSKKLKLDEMQGACITITNLGGIGGVGFSPIVNWPEVAILGVSRAVMEPVWNGDEFVPRLLMPLSLSYDHRIIDGADAARFLRWICQALEQPFLVALES